MSEVPHACSAHSRCTADDVGTSFRSDSELGQKLKSIMAAEGIGWQNKARVVVGRDTRYASLTSRQRCTVSDWCRD